MSSSIVFTESTLEVNNRFTWKINNFAATGQQEEIRSSFKMVPKIDLPYDCEWSCCLIKEGTSYFNTLKVELTKRPSNLAEFNVAFLVKIFKPNKDDGSLYATKTGFANMAQDNWVYQDILSSGQICNPPIQKDGSLEIEISSTLDSPKYDTVDSTLNEFQEKFTKKLQLDLGNMFTNLSLPHSDSPTTIVCKRDNQEFPVHRCLLAARSVVFSTMFESEMKENFTGVVEVTDVSSKVMKIILHFLYTGTLLENWSKVNIVELLYTSAKYEMHDLMEFLDSVIGQMCTVENVGKLMNLAKKLNLKRAEHDLFIFIKNSSDTYEQFEKLMQDVNSDFVFGTVKIEA